MTTMPLEIDTTISLPGDWLTFEPSALAERRSVDELVGDRLAELPELAEHREALVTSVADTMARAEDEGVFLTAVMAAVDDAGHPLLANLAIAIGAAPSGQRPDPAAEDAGTDADRHAPPAPVSMADLEAEVARADTDDGVTQRAVDSVLLGSGPAVRIARLSDVPLFDGGPALQTLSVQYFVPVPDGDSVAILSFATPSVGAHLRMQAIFHQIASTFAIV
jgi:hypothetical protein